jgi:hypothetical protein
VVGVSPYAAWCWLWAGAMLREGRTEALHAAKVQGAAEVLRIQLGQRQANTEAGQTHPGDSNNRVRVTTG